MADTPLTLKVINRGPSLYEAVSEQLVQAILDADLPAGSKIPSERELGDRFGVSRTVIREAIRHLAAKGVLEVQTGSGVHVASVGHAGISESIDMYMRQRGSLDPGKIHEVRETLELRTVQLATERATEAEVVGIRQSCEAMASVLADAEKSSTADIAFHRAIADATGNQLFLLLLDSLSEVMIEIRRATLVDPDRGAVALAAHRRIAEAIEARDTDLAVDAMREHLADSLLAFSRVRKPL